MLILLITNVVEQRDVLMREVLMLQQMGLVTMTHGRHRIMVHVCILVMDVKLETYKLIKIMIQMLMDVQYPLLYGRELGMDLLGTLLGKDLQLRTHLTLHVVYLQFKILLPMRVLILEIIWELILTHHQVVLLMMVNGVGVQI